MAEGMLSISWSPSSLKQIAELVGFAGLLSPVIQQALSKGGDLLVEASRAQMHWVNPTGALEASMQKMEVSPFELLVGSDLIYSRRRELGFHGADALGRMYNDMGAFFLTDALAQNQDEILALLQQGMETLLGQGGMP